MAVDPARRPHDVDQCAVLAPVAVFEADPVAAGGNALGFFERAAAVFVRDEVEQPAARHFVRAIPQQLLAARADVDKCALRIHEEDNVEEEIGNIR